MRHYAFIAMVLATISVLPGCKTPSTESVAKDIGVINTDRAETLVLYGENGKVFLKDCLPLQPPPLTRACRSPSEPQSLDTEDYLSQLPYHIGRFQANEESLSIVLGAIAAAEELGDHSAVERLQGVAINLRKILAIEDELAQGQTVTYYDFQSEFHDLIQPFSSVIPGPIPDGCPLWIGERIQSIAASRETIQIVDADDILTLVLQDQQGFIVGFIGIYGIDSAREGSRFTRGISYKVERCRRANSDDLILDVESLSPSGWGNEMYIAGRNGRRAFEHYFLSSPES
jgi:hypothetical protein